MTTPDGEECNWGKVLVWDPPHHLVLSWQIGVGFVPNTNPDQASRVDIRFIEKDPDQTTIILVHSEFDRHDKGWESMRDGVSGEGGWSGMLKKFADLSLKNKSRNSKR